VEINLTQPGRVHETAFLAGVYPQLYSTLAIWSDTQVLNLVRKFYVVSSECAYLDYIPIAMALRHRDRNPSHCFFSLAFFWYWQIF